MIARSLRLRLLAFAVLANAVALWAAWHVMGEMFERYTEQRMTDGLIKKGDALVTVAAAMPLGQLRTNSGDVDERFNQRASGIYWQIVSPAGRLTSPSLGEKAFTTAGPAIEAGWTADELPGPYEEDLISVARRVVVHGVPLLVRVGQDDEAIDRAQAEFAGRIGTFLIPLGLALCLAAWVQVELGLRPLRRVRDDLAAIQRNPARRLGTNHPQEIAGLVDAINALASAREEDVARARRRAADLAHALKTPLAALAAQNRLARAAGANGTADAIDQTLSVANAVVEAELARARAAASRIAATSARIRPAELIEGLFAVLERTEAGMNLVFDAAIPDELEIGVDGEAFAEIFGNLLDNAARHARRMVRVSAETRDGRILVRVDDDGPGIPADRRDAVLRRGVRLDEAGPGHGLGLAIVTDLTEATSGRLQLADAPDGGLRVEISWPATIAAVAT